MTRLGLNTAVIGVTKSPSEQASYDSWQHTQYFPVTSSHPLRGRSQRKSLSHILEELNPRIILAHTHGLVTEVVIKSRHAERKPALIVREAHASALRSWKDNVRSLLALQHASALVFLSQDQLETFPLPLLSLKGRPEVFIIPNAAGQSKRKLTKDLASQGTLRIGMATRLVPGKRVRLLIDVVAFLHKKGIEVELLIAGDGQDREVLVEYAAGQLAENSVRFLGSVSQEKMTDFYSSLAVYVHLSDGEGESNAVLEAAAHGLTIVMSQYEGIPDFMAQSMGVFLVPNEVKRIGEVISILNGRRAELRTLGQINAKLVTAERSVGAMLNGYLEMFSIIDPEGPWSMARHEAGNSVREGD